MRALVAIPVLLVAAALAGCLGSSEPPQPVTPSVVPPGPAPGPNITTLPGNATNLSAPEVQRFDGTVAGAGATGIGYVALPTEDNAFEFDLRNGTAGFVVELVWNGSSPLHLALGVPPEACTAGSAPAGLQDDCPAGPDAVEGASPLKVLVVDPAMFFPGTWSGSVFAGQSVPGPTAFTAIVSAFYGPPPTDAYTAVVG